MYCYILNQSSDQQQIFSFRTCFINLFEFQRSRVYAHNDYRSIRFAFNRSTWTNQKEKQGTTGTKIKRVATSYRVTVSRPTKEETPIITFSTHFLRTALFWGSVLIRSYLYYLSLTRIFGCNISKNLDWAFIYSNRTICIEKLFVSPFYWC